MKFKFFSFFIFCFFLFISCTENTDNSNPVGANDTYFRMNIDGTEVQFDTQDANAYNTAHIEIKGDKFIVRVNSGFQAGSTNWNNYVIVFDKQGNFLSFNRNGNGYSNYKNYPSHYFNLNIISLDEINKKIKVSFSGKLYIDNLDLNSESNEVSGELMMNYDGNETLYSGLLMGPNIPQYCTAQLNGNLWTAKFEDRYSIFTAEDPYKIVIHFDVNELPGTFDVTPASTNNYITFSKFNTETLLFDNYSVTGLLAHSYREYHGMNQYSFIGTFSFTAVNLNNPTDIIQVTEGSFRSYQSF